MDVQQTELLIREKLETTGQLNKMRAMVIDASLRAIAGSSTAADPSELFAVSPNMQRLRDEQPEDLRRILSVTVECLQWLGLAYSANVVSVESGVKPTELTKRDGLAAALGCSTAPGSASIIQQLLEGGGGVAVGANNGSSAASSPQRAASRSQSPGNNTTAAVNNISAVGNTTATGMTSFGSADAAANAANKSAASSTAASAVNTTTNTTGNLPVINPNDVDDTSAPKPHRMSENSTHVISRWADRTFKRHGQVNGQPMNIDYLEGCKVVVLDDMDSTNIDDCKDTIFIFASVANSIFLRTSENCIVYAACKQFRVRDCTNCEVRLFAGTDPVVETSSNILFKPFNLRLPGLKNSFAAAGLDPAVNRYVHVYDFNAEDTKYPEPHFIVEHDNHGLEMEDMCEEDGVPECPIEIEMLLDGRLAPAASVESGANKSHNIKSGATAWTGNNSGGAASSSSAGGAAPQQQHDEDEEEDDDYEASSDGAAAGAGGGEMKFAEKEEAYSDFSGSSSDASEKYSHSEDDDEF